MKKIMTTCVALLTLFAALAQAPHGTASLRIWGETKAPLEGATVEVLRSRDSALVRSALTDKSGQALVENLPVGSYLARVTLVGHQPAYTAPFDLTGTVLSATIPDLTLFPKAATQLQNVTVTGRKPFIQKLNDRIIVNVESSIVSAGSSALDVLERSPGITVDQNDAISLRGRAGVIVMIDGKPSPLSAADLANYLRGLPANAIERIEIITNPSARYDAAGNSGIIDIRMKKDQRMGANGTLTAGYGQGVYPKVNGGITWNYRNKKANVFGNYNYNFRKNLNHLFLNRNFYENKVFTSYDDKDNFAVIPVSSHAARAGADFFPSKRTIVGFVVNANFASIDRNTDNHVMEYDANRQLRRTFQAQGASDDHNRNAVANVNFKHTFDSTGRELTADIDYGEFRNRSMSTMFTAYKSFNGNPLTADYRLDGDQDGQLKLRTGKADYVHPLAHSGRFEAGVKTSYVTSDNDQKFFDLSNGTSKIDSGKTNRFFYHEWNNAVYANLSKDWKKVNLQVGLRAEQTRVKTHQVRNNVDTAFQYLQLFPSAFFNYKLTADRTLGLSVSRRIDRPGYGQLNPFLFLIDVSTYGTGAPGLKPQITWSYEASYTAKQVSFTLGYSHTTDVQNIALLRYRDAFPKDTTKGENVTIQIPVNLSSSDYVGLTVTAPIHLRPWWNMVSNINVYYNYFEGNLAGTALANGSPAADLRVNNTFTFKKGWTAELNGSYSSGGRYGYMMSDPQWAVGAGVQKTVLKGAGTVRLNVTDIFWTNLPKATVTYDNYIENWHATRESRVANLAFTYRFGNNKVAAARRRTTASEEERKRAQ
jgi:iron complex outermembrane receptor protein